MVARASTARPGGVAAPHATYSAMNGRGAGLNSNQGTERTNLAGEVRIQIHTPDLPVLEEFYANRLGLEVTRRFPNDEGMLLQLVDDVLIELLPSKRPTRDVHLGAEVRSIVIAHNRWGDVASAAPADQPWGHISFDVVDPQNNQITFFEVVE